MRVQLTALITTAALASAAGAGVFNTNLVTNGSFESFSALGDDDVPELLVEGFGVATLDGWDVDSSPSGGPLTLDLYQGQFPFRNPPAGGGDYVLFGDQNLTSVSQEIDLTGFARGGSALGYELSGYLGSFDFAEGTFDTMQEDQAFLSVTFYNAMGDELASDAVDGPTLASDVGLDFSVDGNFSGLRSTSGLVPLEAASAVIEIEFVIDPALPGTFNNANADLIDFRIVPAPSGVAVLLGLAPIARRRRSV